MTISKKLIIENMTRLGIYQPEFDVTIEIYVGLVKQYNALEKQFKSTKFEVNEKTGYAENSKRSPIVSSLENLRKDILKYATDLGLTPAGLKRLKDKGFGRKKSGSPVAAAVKKFEQ